VENNIYNWVYTGGCYKNNEAAYYAPATPGETYNFKTL
jgi:hypothetical protein